MTTGIYKITCKETGHCYIGQSKNIEKRWKAHQKKCFPPQSFDYEILVTCPIADLNELEVLMIKTFDSHHNGFNKTIGGTSIKTTHLNAKTLAKISASLTGRTLTDEHKANVSAAVKNAPKFQCPYCFKVMGVSNLKRWHEDNCKFKTMEKN